MIVHLDPVVLGRLAAQLTERELRVVVALLSLAPDGELIGQRRAWARAAGLRVRELEEVVGALTRHLNKAAVPLLVVIANRRTGDTTVRFVAPPGLLVPHPLGRRTDDLVLPRRPTTGARGPLLREPAVVRDEAAARLAAAGPELARLAEAWIGHLAALEGRETLAWSLQVAQYETLMELVGHYGVPIVAEALTSSIRNVREVRAPERYLRVVAQALYTEANTARVPRGSRQPAQIDGRASSRPVRDPDAF